MEYVKEKQFLNFMMKYLNLIHYHNRKISSALLNFNREGEHFSYFTDQHWTNPENNHIIVTHFDPEKAKIVTKMSQNILALLIRRLERAENIKVLKLTIVNTDKI